MPSSGRAATITPSPSLGHHHSLLALFGLAMHNCTQAVLPSFTHCHQQGCNAMPYPIETEILTDCAYCESRVLGKVLAHNDEYEEYDDHGTQIVFTKCPACRKAMVGVRDAYQESIDTWDFSRLRRLWPMPDRIYHHSIPGPVRDSLEEAEKCFRATAYSACAVMCGRALEAICAQETGAKTLAKGLQALKDKGVIDQKIFGWGESLRQERNIGAHATGVKLSKDDAQDILDFAIAICDYVYVLMHKHARYTERKRSDHEKKDPSK